MGGRPERAAGQQLELLRSAGYAAFAHHERDLAVLDLIYDSLVDGSDIGDDVRHLRFAGHGWTLDVDARGRGQLTVDLWVCPAGPVVVEARAGDADDPVTRRLVSFLLRWPGTARRPVRTAWIML
ncbi:hypothetical protein [Kribbella italica]|uniref:Uncharacterized protein n=1 Tax=Kribbella italica TaxID=1540520 RepID=A0A7W9J1W6_9ACTN|nr:hypothetical protein [Kribbella italica]MBB5834094.1 hypothetical protein [Kribbella italica]